jgi:hypothetical protein
VSYHADSGTRVSSEHRAAISSDEGYLDIEGAPQQAPSPARTWCPASRDWLASWRSCSAGELDTKISGITSAIRAGQPVDVKQKLIEQITASWFEIAGQPAKQVVAGLTEIDSDVTMEYGLILPHPGDEAAWFVDNADALERIQGTGL